MFSSALHMNIFYKNEWWVSMGIKWFRVYQGVAQGVEYVEENSTTTATNFHLEGLKESMVNVPGQAKHLIFIKEGDLVDFCGRPSLFDQSKTVCLAYRINMEGTIYSINELRHVTMVILGCIFGSVYVMSSVSKWPVMIVAAITIYYAISAYCSFHARGCLAKVKQ